MSIKEYEPLAIIGKGAFGEVRVCKEKITGNVVAIKKNTYDLYGFYRSVDGGTNFTLQANTPNIMVGVVGSQAWYNLCMAVSPIHKDTIIAAGTDSWKSTDGGLTWTQILAPANFGANLKIKRAGRNRFDLSFLVTFLSKKKSNIENTILLYRGN